MEGGQQVRLRQAGTEDLGDLCTRAPTHIDMLSTATSTITITITTNDSANASIDSIVNTCCPCVFQLTRDDAEVETPPTHP